MMCNHTGEDYVAITAPNRYRKIYLGYGQDGKRSRVEIDKDQEEIRKLMSSDFPDKGDPLGLGLCFCFDQILMWSR